MPIRGFDVYLQQASLLQETRLSALSNTRLGIDGNNWLRLLLTGVRSGEPTAIGGVPQALENAVSKELEFYSKHKITPIFVFSGLAISRKENRPNLRDDRRSEQRNDAWAHYWKSHHEQAMYGWSTAGIPAQADMVPYVMHVLQRLGAECMRAPYSAWAQLAYLVKHKAQPIHAVYSSTDIIMYDVDRVVTAVNVSKGTFTWMVRDNLLAHFNLPFEHLLDACVLAGVDGCSTLPPLINEMGFTFRSAVDTVRYYRGGFTTVQMYADHPQVKPLNYADMYCRTHAAIRYHIVLQLDGTVAPLNAEYAPNDLHDIIGYRFPNTVYQLLARGTIHPQTLNVLVYGSWLEFLPLDNGESSEIHRLVTQWVRKSATASLDVLCASLGPFFRQRKIAMSAWFDPTNEMLLHDVGPVPGHKPIGPSLARTSASSVGSDLKAILQQGAEISSFVTVDPKAPKTPSAGLSTDVFVSTLALLGFVNRTDGKPTQLGRALLAGLQTLPTQSTLATQWAVLVAVVLMEQGLLTGNKWSVAYEDAQAPVGGNAAQQKHIRLLSRIAALLPLAGRNGPLKVPYNRDLLAFGSAVRLAQKTTLGVLESAMVVQSLAEPDLAQPLVTELCELRDSLPYDFASTDALGLAVHSLLASYAKDSDGTGCWTKFVQTVGDSVADPAAAAGDAWALANAVLAANKVLGEQKAGKSASAGKSPNAAVAGDLKAACEWARPLFRSAPSVGKA
ncbi:hypothetical protein FBU59_000273 [Linderina macrospora]|uniref:Uncharacterized protein n=1 Tax=Linderina macrospora TaxID=4868 RepID=A0ACC1JHD6_9FUNG|nr:hypothetical protein FBU59_000273 [Linderina macrospora]